MLELFMSMVKEEWRLHSTLFGSLSFALFPVLIGAISFMGALLLPVFRELVPAGDLATLTNASFVLLGVMVGAFGLIGTEVMNRRFGQASLLAYSARTLPLSERTIFTTFVIKDICYYCLLWVFPFVVGYALATPLISVSWEYAALLCISLTLSFLSGLSAVFFLSTVYARSRQACAVLLLLTLGAAVIVYLSPGPGIMTLFPPFTLLYTGSLAGALATITGILVLFAASVLLFSGESAGISRHYPNSLAVLTKKMSASPNPAITAKDFLDLHRSGSDIGHVIFSLLLPLGIIWFFLAVLARVIPGDGVLFLFAGIAGVISATIYTWLTAFDSYTTYACLPVGVAEVIRSKIWTFSILQIIPALFLAIVTLGSGYPGYLSLVLVLWASVTFYALAMTVYLTGLSPHVLIYDARVLLCYLVAVGIVVLFMTALAFINPYLSFAALLLLLPAWVIGKKGIRKWDSRDQPGF